MSIPEAIAAILYGVFVGTILLSIIAGFKKPHQTKEKKSE